MVTAATTALAPIASAFANQPRRPRAERKSLPSASDAIALSPNIKAAKLALKNAREERLHDIITQPEVMGWAITILGLFAVQNIPFSEEKVTNEVIQGTATTATVLMGLGHAGVGDLTTAVMAGLSGVASILAGIGIPDISSILNPDISYTFPGLNKEESKDVVRKGLLYSMPFGLGHVIERLR